jgi:hypothetical protein
MLKFSNPSTVRNTGHIRTKNILSTEKKNNNDRLTHTTCMYILYHSISVVRNDNACELKNLCDAWAIMYDSKNMSIIVNVQEFEESGYDMQKCQFSPVQYIT